MKHTIAPSAEMNRRPPLLLRPRREPERRASRSGAPLLASLMPALVAALAACQAGPEPSSYPMPPEREGEPLASSEQGLSVADCRQDLSGCLSATGGVTGSDQCTLDFESCFSQATQGNVGQGQLVAECRATADDCLDAALNPTDIGACGDGLVECADDVRSDPRGFFPLVRPLVSRVLVTGVRTLRGLVDVSAALPAAALSGVKICRDEVVTCLDGAVSDLDIGTCADSLDVCVDGVVDVIDPIVDPLPGPSGSGIVAATDACRGDARDCLAGAVSLGDISACSDLLGACVDGIDAIVGETVDDVNDIIDPLAVPQPEELVDCTLDLVECLADLQNPFDCAEQARLCALP